MSPTARITDAGTIADAAARARLEPDASQRTFRALLDALARPGEPASIPDDAAPGLPRPLVPVLALADVDVTVAILDDAVAADRWHDVVRTATGARRVPAPDAQMVVALRTPLAREVAGLRRGAAEVPELGARLIVACRAVIPAADPPPPSTPAVLRRSPSSAPPPTVDLELRGPGVPDVRRVRVVGIGADVLASVGASNGDYPAGVDTWLVADDGTIVGIPRSVAIVVEAVA